MSGIDCFLLTTQRVTIEELERALLESDSIQSFSFYESPQRPPHFCAVVETLISHPDGESTLSGWSNIFLLGKTKILKTFEKRELKVLNRATNSHFQSALHLSGGSRRRPTAFSVGKLLLHFLRCFGGYAYLEYRIPGSLFEALPSWKKQTKPIDYLNLSQEHSYTLLDATAMAAFLSHPFFHIINQKALGTFIKQGFIPQGV